MKTKTLHQYQARVKVAKALAHPSRMLILDVLQEKEMCVSELTELIGCDQSTVSKHISVLKNAGLVHDRKQGLNVYYQITCECLQTFFDCLEKVIDSNRRLYQ